MVDAFNNRMQLFLDDGTFVRVLSEATGELSYPYDVTVAPDGTLYVVEYKSGRIAQLAPDGTLLGRYGRSGRDTGQFATPWGIAFRGENRIVVADTGNRRIVEIEL